MKEEDAIDEMILAAIVSGEEVEAVKLFGEYRAAGAGGVEACQRVLKELDL